jgi:hypothetical protein
MVNCLSEESDNRENPRTLAEIDAMLLRMREDNLADPKYKELNREIEERLLRKEKLPFPMYWPEI